MLRTSENTPENELVAGFMEYPYIPVKAGFETGGSYSYEDKEFTNKHACLSYCDKLNELRDPEQCYFPLPRPSGFADFRLKYDTSWEWLHPVVDKIEELYSKAFPPGAQFTDMILAGRKMDEIIDRHFMDVVALPITSSIEEVFTAVIEFIKWYNAQNIRHQQ